MSIPDHFRALIISEPKDGGQATAKLATIPRESLPTQGEVLIQVFYSSLNYKDALAVTGRGKIVRSFPMVPGIDLAGIVVESSDSRFKRGDPVIATGWGLGERYWGGLAEYASVKADWLLPVPPGLSLLTSMAFGTAGLTAMLSVLALEQSGMTPKSGREVLVTGASGGLGSFAIAFLHRRGYKVAALSHRKSNRDYLSNLGADSVIDLSEFLATFRRPLESERWAGAIDSVGGDVLSALLSGMAYRERGCLLWIGSSHRIFCDGLSVHPARSSIDWHRLGLLSTRRAAAGMGRDRENAAPQRIGRNYWRSIRWKKFLNLRRPYSMESSAAEA